jgi:hypothetical protein
MERRKAVVAAATASLTLLAGAAAISLNTSLVGASGDDGVGEVSPVDPATTAGTVYVDEPATAPTTSPSPSLDDEDEFERDESDGVEDDGHGDDGTYLDDVHEYEGADDDD